MNFTKDGKEKIIMEWDIAILLLETSSDCIRGVTNSCRNSTKLV
jgi:hypothetical protein